jgi:hypothetical protein
MTSGLRVLGGALGFSITTLYYNSKIERFGVHNIQT